MNKLIKTVLLGLIVWIIPFLSSFFVWDVKAGAPSIDIAWFYALMGVTGAIGIAIAAYFQFKDVHKNSVKEGWQTGAIWYVELIALDFVFLVGVFGMALTAYFHLLLTYLAPLILCVAFGYIKK